MVVKKFVEKILLRILIMSVTRFSVSEVVGGIFEERFNFLILIEFVCFGSGSIAQDSRGPIAC